MLLTLIIFTIVNIILAFIDAHKIIKGATIKHFLNGLIYCAMIAVPYIIFQNYFLIGALLFNRLLVFNIMLSLFRGLAWDYITPENPPKSMIDRIAKMIFGFNGVLMYSVYAVLFIILTIFTFTL